MANITQEQLDKHIHEEHFSHRMGWLRAAVLGANDGIISVVSLLVGVIAAGTDQDHILIVAIAALVAGALSMAAGEYVSVSSQADTELADLEKEKIFLETDWDREVEELAAIYERRGVRPETALTVAKELMEHDALDAHLRDELGLSDAHSANPMQAAFFSAAAFTAGSIIPVLIASYIHSAYLGWIVAGASLILLAILGALAAYAGGASIFKGMIRVVVWGAIAMGVTTGVGLFFGSVA